MVRSNLELQITSSPVLRYGLAVLSVSVALAGSLLLQHFQFRNVADPLFLFAIAIAVWYAGIGPGILAVVLSGLADTYFFIEPIYSLYMTRDDLPHFIIFVLFAGLLTGFAAVVQQVFHLCGVSLQAQQLFAHVAALGHDGGFLSQALRLYARALQQFP